MEKETSDMEQEKRKMTDAEIAFEIRKVYPQMDAPLYSKTKHSVMTGVQLTDGAKNIEHRVIYGDSQDSAKIRHIRKERADMRKCTVRIPVNLIIRLQRLMDAFGVDELNKIVNMVLSYGTDVLEVENEKAVG